MRVAFQLLQPEGATKVFSVTYRWEVTRGMPEVFDRTSLALVRRPRFSYSCMRPRPGSAVQGSLLAPVSGILH